MSLDPHGGNIYAYDGVKLDFSVNLNPLGYAGRDSPGSPGPWAGV